MIDLRVFVLRGEVAVMDAETLGALVSSVAGVLGAGVGGWIGFAAASSDRKSRRASEDRAHAESVTTLRREIYAAFLAKIDRFCEDAQSVTAAIDSGANREECEQAQKRHEIAWASMVESMGAVQMIAPYEIGVAAADVWAAAAEYSNAVDDRFRGKRWSSAFNVKVEAVIETRRYFVRQALESLGVSVPRESDTAVLA